MVAAAGQVHGRDWEQNACVQAEKKRRSVVKCDKASHWVWEEEGLRGR